MKRLLLFTLIVTIVNTNLQAQKHAEHLYDKGIKAYRASKFTIAERYFRQLVDDYPNTLQWRNSILALGVIYYQTAQYANGTKLLLPFFQQYSDDKKGIIKKKSKFIDKYFIHDIGSLLSSIYEKEKKYNTAMYYLVLVHKKYPPFMMCNFDNDHNNTIYAIARSRIYEEMGKPTKAQQELLRISFHFADDDKAAYIDSLKKLLLKYNDRQQLKVQLSQSLHRFTVDTTYDPTWHREYTLYITFLRTKINVRYPYPEDPDRIKVLLYLKKSPLYQMVQSL
jgi:predicted Zn-dependent protease